MRVWNEATIRGSMMLALLSETAVAMARYELRPKILKKKIDGKTVKSNVRPSTESMVWSLSHLTLTRLVEKGKRKSTHFSNWDMISREVFSNIRSE